MSYAIAKQSPGGTVRFFSGDGCFYEGMEFAKTFITRSEAVSVARTISSPTLALDTATNVRKAECGRWQLTCPATDQYMVLVNHDQQMKGAATAGIEALPPTVG